jgi:hypothetical protein
MNPRYLNESDRMVYLAEYQVRRGVPLNASSQARVSALELLDEAEPGEVAAPAAEAAAPAAELPAAPEAAVEPQAPAAELPAAPAEPQAPVDSSAPSPAADKVELLTQLAHAENDQITELRQKLDAMSAQLAQLGMDSESQVRAVGDRLEAVTSQVRKLTPPSPLEQLRSMATLSGGVSMEDYFNEWAAKNGDPTRVGPNAMYQAAEHPEGQGETFYVKTDQVPDLSVEEARRSLGLDSRGY